MSDQRLPRVFKIGATRIVEDESTAQLTTEEVRDLLKPTYPEIAHAAVRERDDLENGVRVIEWLPQPGRKG